MKNFHLVTADDPASPILLRTLEKRFSPGKVGRALDVGCGSGRDSLELLKRGWRVVALDASFEGLSLLQRRARPDDLTRLELMNARFQDCAFSDDSFDWVHASYSLPFCMPARFPEFWAGLVKSLRSDGWFTGQFFGPKDSWASDPGFSIFSREDVMRLLNGFDVLEFKEAELDAAGRTAPLKHWHVFHVVARKV